MSKPPIKLIALDIDGTILNKNFELSLMVKSSLQNAIKRGLKVVLATGRMHSATVPVAEEIGIKTPLITYQGALIKEYLNSNDVILHQPVPDSLARLVLEELRTFDIQTNLYIDDILYTEQENDILSEYAVKRFVKYNKIDSFDEFETLNTTKILAISRTENETDKLICHLNKKFNTQLYITKSMPEYCEISDIKVSKGNAIVHLASRWGINPSEIMVAGDGENDIEMLKVAGMAVAMGNASDIVKKEAHIIAESVDNDGIATIIDNLEY